MKFFVSQPDAKKKDRAPTTCQNERKVPSKSSCNCGCKTPAPVMSTFKARVKYLSL